MTNSLQSTSAYSAKYPAIAASRRATEEDSTQFDDLLPAKKTRENGAGGGTTGNLSSHHRQVRHVADDQAAASAHSASDEMNSRRPTQALSAQQAILAAPNKPEPRADEATAEAGTADLGAVDNGSQAGGDLVDSAPPPAKPPLIMPHNPPVSPGDNDDGAPLTTGGIKTPPSGQPAPHDPPAMGADDLPTDTAGENGKIPGIRPHGPIDPTPLSQLGAQATATADPEDTFQPLHAIDALPPGSTGEAVELTANPPKGPFTTTIPAPASGANPTGSTTPPVNGMAKGEYTTKIPATGNPMVDGTAINPAVLAESAPATIPITTVAQAQLAASMVASAPGNIPDAGDVGVSDPKAANLAGRIGPATTKGAFRKSVDSSQNTDDEGLATDQFLDGTAAAKRQASVTTYPSNSATASERDTLSRQDAAAFVLPDSSDGRGDESATSRAKDGDAVRASTATAPTTPVSFAATLTPAVDAASTAPSSGIMRVDQVETLLQTVQDTAQRFQFDGSGQVELRVRLDGVADDVTVRVRMDENKLPQVNFQTASPELRAALEQGWSDLAANAATASSAASGASEFAASQPAATASADSVSPAPEFYRENRRLSQGTASTTGGSPSARRWSGYA